MMYAVSRLLQLERGSEVEARALLAVVLSLELSDGRIIKVNYKASEPSYEISPKPLFIHHK